MSVPNDVLRVIREERQWVDEGPDDPEGKPQIFWHKASGWKGTGFFDDPNPARVAARVDGRLLIGDDLRRLSVGSLTDSNPRHVVFRLVEQTTKVRSSVILIRADLCPAQEEELQAAMYT